MKKTTKLLAILLALFTLLSLAACGGGGKEPEKPAEIGGDISAGELLLVDKDGMKITLTSIEDRGEYWFFNLRGENNSKNTLSIELEDIVLNGYIDPDHTIQHAFQSIAPGETKENYVFVHRWPEQKGIFDKVIKADISFGIEEEYQIVEHYPVATVYGADKDAEMPSVQDGKLVYDKNDVKVWVDKDLYPDADKKSTKVYFNIENNSGKDIIVIPESGFVIDGIGAKSLVDMPKVGDGLKLRDYVCPVTYDEKADFSKVSSMKMSLEVNAVDGSWMDKVDTFDLYE